MYLALVVWAASAAAGGVAHAGTLPVVISPSVAEHTRFTREDGQPVAGDRVRRKAEGSSFDNEPRRIVKYVPAYVASAGGALGLQNAVWQLLDPRVPLHCPADAALDAMMPRRDRPPLDPFLALRVDWSESPCCWPEGPGAATIPVAALPDDRSIGLVVPGQTRVRFPLRTDDGRWLWRTQSNAAFLGLSVTYRIQEFGVPSLRPGAHVPMACHFVVDDEQIVFDADQLDAVADNARRSAERLREVMSAKPSIAAACRYRALQAQVWAAALLGDSSFAPVRAADPWSSLDPFAWLAEPVASL